MAVGKRRSFKVLDEPRITSTSYSWSFSVGYDGTVRVQENGQTVETPPELLGTISDQFGFLGVLPAELHAPDAAPSEDTSG